jgi:integrase
VGKALTEQQKDIYSNFIDSLKSHETKHLYAYFLKVFMKFHRLEESDYSALFVNPEQKIKEYLVYASNEKDYSKSHFAIMICTLKNFYQMNDVDTLNWNKLKRFVGETRPQHKDRAYEQKQILTLVQSAPSLKLKTIILLMASSGIRIGALPNIRLSHLEKIDNENIYKISVYEGLKGKGHYFTFCTPEATNSIDQYIEFRKRCGEPITKDSLLFRKDFDSQFHEQARNHIEPTNLDSIRSNIDRLLIKTGVKQVDRVNPSHRQDVKMSHGFRKFFVTQLVNADIHDVIIKKLSGHKLERDMTFVYSKQTDDKLLSEYMKAVDLLTINEENRLRRKVEILTIEKSKVDLALSQIEEMKKKIGLA